MRIRWNVSRPLTRLASLATLSRRERVHELLDEHDAPAEDVERSLRDLRRFNRYCGGTRAYRLLLRRLAGRRDLSDLAILDLGTGTSDLLESLPDFRSLQAFGLDIKIDHLTYGRRTGHPATLRLAGDATCLPFRDDSVDIVTSSHFFHHFDEQTNARILDESLRVSRVGVMVTDTRRHYAPWLFCKVLGWCGLVGRITRFDAPASVLQGFVPREVAAIADGMNATRWEIVGVVPFRFGLLLWKE